MNTNIEVDRTLPNLIMGSSTHLGRTTRPFVQVPMSPRDVEKYFRLPERGVDLADPQILHALTRQFDDPIVTVVSPQTQEVLAMRKLDSFALYYIIENDGTLRWATDPNRLITPSAENLNYAYLASAIFESVNPWDTSWLEGIRVLPAGFYLHYYAGEVKLGRHADYEIPELTSESFSSASTSLWQEMLHSTTETIKGFSRPAIQLSGGLDSGTIAAAARELGYPIRGYFAGSSDSGVDIDLESARETADFLNIPLTLVDSSTYLESSHLVDFARSTDWLMTGGFRAQDVRMGEMVESELGPTVLLTGIGGDELFTPDLWNPIAKHGLQALNPARGGAPLAHQAAPPDTKFASTNKRLIHYLTAPETLFPSDGLELSSVFASQEMGTSNWLTELAQEGARAAFLRWKDLIDDEVQQAASSASGEPRFYQMLTYATSKLFLNDARLQSGQSGAFRNKGIHVASPLLSQNVVEYAMRLPSSYRYVLYRGHRISKAVLREAMRGRLPHGVLARISKIDYNSVLQKWLRQNTGILSRLHSDDSPLVNLGFISPTGLRQLVEAGGWALRRESRKLVNALIIDAWLRGNVKGFSL